MSCANVTPFALAAAVCAVAAGASQEMLPDTAFLPCRPPSALSAWQIYGPLGGSLALIGPEKQPDAVALTAERLGLADGRESYEGCLALRQSVAVLPGRRYRFSVEARGTGDMSLGVFEQPWKYSEAVLAGPAAAHALTAEWRALAFDYSPTSDAAAWARPFFRVSGWRNRADLRRPSFQALIGEGEVRVEPGHFLVAQGDRLKVRVAGPNLPVKLLLYGPDGVCGPGGPLGGSSGWTDHYKRSVPCPAGQGEVAVEVETRPDDIEGVYRLAAVDTRTGAAGEAHFDVRPRPRAQQILALVDKVSLPDGSRLVFLGDSLTALFPTRNYVAQVARALQWKFPGRVEVINASVGGDNILRIEERVAKDVLARKPSLVFLFEGANDTKRRNDPKTGQILGWAVPQDAYEAALRRVAERIVRDGGARLVLMTCAPADRGICARFEAEARLFEQGVSHWGLPEDMAQLLAIQERVARDLKLDAIPTHAALVAAMMERDRAGGHHLHVDDGVHLSEYGSREVTLAVLRYLTGER